MFKTIKRRLTNLYYGLGFGMKAGDELLATNNVNTNDGGAVIEQQVAQKSVYQDLLKGELTEEVQALRYSMFKAEEESMDYTYLGNGQAEKKEVSKEEKARIRKHFTQPNKKLEYSKKEIENLPEKDRVNPPDRYLIHIKPKNGYMKFNLEKYIDKIEVNINDDDSDTLIYFPQNTYVTKMYFPIIKEDRKIRPFINYLEKLSDNINLTSNADTLTWVLHHEELCDTLEELSLTTFKASNNLPNGIDYKFLEGKFWHIYQTSDEETKKLGQKFWIIEHKWKKCIGGQLLSEKFYNKAQADRYKSKERKENFAPMLDFNAKKE